MESPEINPMPIAAVLAPFRSGLPPDPVGPAARRAGVQPGDRAESSDRSGIVLPARLAAGSRPGAVRGLHRLLKHLHANRVEFVSVPIPAKDGATLVASDGRWWQLEPWLPGRADFHAFPSEARLAAAMRRLATPSRRRHVRGRRRRSGHG